MYSLHQWNQEVVRRPAFWGHTVLVALGIIGLIIDYALWGGPSVGLARLVGFISGVLIAYGGLPWVTYIGYRLAMRERS